MKFELLCNVPEDRRERMLDAYDDVTQQGHRTPNVFIIYEEGKGFRFVPGVK